MMRSLARIFPVLSMFWLVPGLSGQIPASKTLERPGNEVIWDGIYAFYTDDFDKSVKILTDARQRFPEHPTVHFTWAVSKWLRTQAYDGVEESYSVLEQALNEIIPIYEKYVDQFPNEPQYRLYLAASKGLMARIHLGRKEWFGVLVEGVKGYREAKAVHEENPELWDAYMPIGLLNFFAGNMSPFVQFLAGLFGVEADRDLGLSQLKIAAEKGEYSWIETSQLLVFIYLWMDDDYEAALAVTEKLRERLPGSMYNQHLYTETLIRLNRLDEAEANLALTYQMVKKLPPRARQGWLATLKYQEALMEFYRGSYDRSLDLVTASIQEFSTELDTPLGFGYLLRGKIHDLRGERALALDDYRSALALDNYSSAMQKARRYLRTPYTEKASGKDE